MSFPKFALEANGHFAFKTFWGKKKKKIVSSHLNWDTNKSFPRSETPV